MDYPNDKEVLETFECAEPVRASYRFALISRCLRALQSSTKTSLRISADGLMSMQFLMPNPSPRRGAGTSGAFIDFVVSLAARVNEFLFVTEPMPIQCMALDEDIAS